MDIDMVLFMWISVLAISVLGTLAHFVYDFSKHNKVMGLFGAVNESTWEHIKIALTATLLWSLVDGAFFGINPNYFLAKIASLIVIVLVIPLIFYSYRKVTKKSILIVDIALFYVAIILSQACFYGIMRLPDQGLVVEYISVVATFVFFGAYMTLTLAPLKEGLFKDPLTGKYGFRGHSHRKPGKK